MKVVSRRYDEASSSTRVLEFSAGVTTRPILRPATGQEVRHFGGTSGTVRLRTPPSGAGGLLRHGAKEQGAFRLDEACGFVAPTLDCDLEAKYLDDSYRRCVSADDWITIPGVELLRRISSDRIYGSVFPGTRQPLAEVAERLRLIEVDGRVIARASLAPAPPAAVDTAASVLATSACVTVGGLRAGGGTGGITGVVVGRPTTAERLRYEIEYERTAWGRWATEQATLWAGYVNEQINRGGYTEADSLPKLVIRLDGYTDGMLVGRNASGPLTIDSLKQWAASRDEVVLFDEFDVDVQVGAGGEVAIWHRDDHCRLHLHDSILLTSSGGQYGSWEHYGDPAPDKTYASESEKGRHYYYREQLTERGLFLRAIAEAWSQGLDEVVENLEVFDRRVEIAIGLDDAGQNHTSRAVWRARRAGVS